MLSKYSIAAAVATACLYSSPSEAQTDEELQEIVVIANRVPVPLRRIGTSVSIITQEEIEAHGNIALNTVLRQSTGIGASSNGGIGTTSAIRVRGEEGFRTLVMVDGLRLSDQSAPQVATPVEHLLSHGVSRVEILRGPQGLSYGADAGGIVSLVTGAGADPLEVAVGAQSGSFGTSQATTNISFGTDRIDISLAGSKFQNDGYNTRISDTAVADDDGYDNTTFHGRIGFELTDDLRMQFVHRDVKGETQYDGCFAGTTVYDCESIYDFQASRLSLEYVTEDFSHSVAYNSTQTDREDFALGAFAFGGNGESRRWEYVGSATSLPGFDLVLGVDLEQEENGQLQRDNEGYYLEVLSDFSDRFFVTAGVRQDDNDDFGSYTSYRLSTAYLLAIGEGQLKFKLSYGSGFRAPSLFEVDYNAGPFAFPPASTITLDAETSLGLEYGVEYTRGDSLSLEVVVFDQEVEDAIFFDLAGFSGYLQDLGISTSQGVELSGDWAITPSIKLKANYTYNDSERPNGLQRLRRPEHLTNLGLSYSDSSQRLQVNTFVRMSRNAVDEVFGSQVSLDDFEVWDINASYRVNDLLTVYARLENVLDEDYQEVTDFRAPERAGYIGFQLAL